MHDTTIRTAAVQFWAIEFSAQRLERVAADFVAMSLDMADEKDRGDASGLADAYGMAAKEVRRQIPAFLELEARNLATIKAWDKASAPPKLEQWDPGLASPGGIGPEANEGNAGVPDPCPTCGEVEPRTGTCGTSPEDKRALCNRTTNAGVPERLSPADPQRNEGGA